MAERYEALSKKHEPALVVSIGAAIRMSVAASSSIFQRHCCEETTDEGTAQYVNRSSGMGYHYDRPADEMKLEARRFQEELRRALASSRKVTKSRK
jgi:hypothetical protein